MSILRVGFMKFTNFRVDDDGVEEAPASNHRHDLLGQGRELLVDNGAHLGRVLHQLLLNQDLEALDGHPAGQRVASVG